ncbi:glutathione S-transferase family protein [Paraburkholderia sp. C35]|uniref:glutathione S-transferase family protein n=1 Tax=Paraburkholderia sp. C35 TaxID=2126993 RepID=UPI000D689186|nr:glutathione S-transferase family protein [Paraburkholderia sp. C35]
MKLVIGDKNYSSWSMRPWLVLKHFGIECEEVMVWLNEADSKAQILAHSPSGKVPCLIADDGVSVWDSLAICETLAERYPQHAMWPRDAVARGHARSISAEMHSGFGNLRNNMWMNIRASFPGKGATPEALADIARIDEIWNQCLETYGGPFLFGEFTIADAMYAPVVMRFNTWQPKLSEAAAAYARRVTAQPAVKAWIDDALQEPHRIPYQDTCA